MKNIEYPITLDNFRKNVKFIESIVQNIDKCLEASQEIITFIATIHDIEQNKFRHEIKTIFLIGCKMIIQRIGFDHTKTYLSDHDKYTYNTCLQYLDRVLQIEPFNVEAKNMYKIICMFLSKFSLNPKEVAKVLEIHPCDYQLQYFLGILYHDTNDKQQSTICFKLCLGIIDLNLKSKTHNTNEIKILKEFKVKCLDKLSEDYFFTSHYHAEYFLLEALQVLPEDPDIHNKLGCIYNKSGEYDKSKKHFQIGIKHYQKAHISTPSAVLSGLYTNISSIYFNENNYDLGMKSLHKAIEIEPKMIIAYQNLLFNSHFILHTINDPMYLFEKHKNINTLIPCIPVCNEYTPMTEFLNLNISEKSFLTVHKKLKLGFVSGEFRTLKVVAPVSFFMHSILKNINYNLFEVVCYSLLPLDAACNIFENVKWVYIDIITSTRLDEFKKIIKEDNIDILFDLISHTSHSQIELFALKPAPILISYCGYPNTSGLFNMDYHITDRYCDSDGLSIGPKNIVRPSTQKYYTEKLLFMNHCFLCYTPAVDKLPQLQPQPCIKNQYLTLVSFNKLNKINAMVVAVWEKILQRCPNVKLAIKTKELQSQSLKQKFFDLWNDKKVIEQIIFMTYAGSYEEHLHQYNTVDIALDTFPYSGTTTTCEALMMGVPVVTLFDDQRQYHVQNVSTSIMINSDLEEYVCYTEDEYINKVCYYAAHLDELFGLKETIRSKFLNGYVCDHIGFVEEFEDKMLQIYKEHHWQNV